MSLSESIHRNTGVSAKAGFEYLLVYSVCFALYLVPVAIRHLNGRSLRAPGRRNSIISDTSVRAANGAATSLMGI